MEIAWFSESGLEGKVPRYFDNMRTEYAWFVAQNATHHNILKLKHLPDNKYDIGVIIIPKKVTQYMDFDLITQIKRVCKKYAFMQEGPSWYFQDLPLTESLWFYDIMVNSDFILCHNECDKNYYEGLLEKKCFINPTLMIEDSIKSTKSVVDRCGTIIGGNLVRWYGGFNSLMVAYQSNETIWAPSMGRMLDDELLFEDIKHLPYMSWVDWINTLNNFKYAVHLNPNTIAGTFSLNCAYLGIPCIGNIHSDTQRICFPDLSVNSDDIKKAKNLMEKLRIDEKFYVYCSNNSKKLYDIHFKESVYLQKWKNIESEICEL